MFRKCSEKAPSLTASQLRNGTKRNIMEHIFRNHLLWRPITSPRWPPQPPSPAHRLTPPPMILRSGYGTFVIYAAPNARYRAAGLPFSLWWELRNRPLHYVYPLHAPIGILNLHPDWPDWPAWIEAGRSWATQVQSQTAGQRASRSCCSASIV